jgi:glucose-1-phosphate adenylyltransferase
MSRSKLIEIVKLGNEHNYKSLARDILQPMLQSLDMRGYEVEEYAVVMDGPESYARITAEILNSPKIRSQVFSKERPVFTKTRDDMPTKYGLNSEVKNSLIADGCVIEGTVKNSVLFRGVKIGAGSVVEDSIIMQDSEIGENVDLRYVTLDKKVKVGNCKSISGSEVYHIYVRKNAEV